MNKYLVLYELAPFFVPMLWRATFIPSGGSQTHGNSVESHVIPAKAGIHRKWVPAFAGTTFETFKRMGGPQALERSE